MKPVAAIAAVWVVALATTTAPLGQQRATSVGPIADTLVPGPPDRVTLEQHANVFSAFNAFKTALVAANVPYGLEALPMDPGAPPIDLARARESVLTLGGRRLGDVLDAIVREAPQYRWVEVEGTIAVRATADGQGVLDRRVERFSVTDAPPRAALEAVIAALDPSRAKGEGVIGFGRLSGGAGGGPPRTGRNVTLDLKGATVQAILASIARANGDLSWTVRYDRPMAALHSTTITLTELGESVIAQSPASMEAQRARQAPSVQLPIYVSLPAMVEIYARRARVKVSIEQVAYAGFELPSFIALNEVPPIELPDAPALAVPKIVALDSRYEWSERNGRFLVRPKPGVPGRLDVLDQSIPGFNATNEPARSVIDRAAQLVGMTFPQALLSRPGAGAMDAAMSALISVKIASPATVRDVLDGIADATGSTWMLQPRFTPGTPTLLMLQWHGGPAPGGPPASSAWDTTTFVTAFSDLSPALMPTRAPVKALPPALDRSIARATIEVGSTSGPFQQFGSVVQAPMVVENAPPSQRADPRYVTPSPRTSSSGRASSATRCTRCWRSSPATRSRRQKASLESRPPACCGRRATS